MDPREAALTLMEADARIGLPVPALMEALGGDLVAAAGASGELLLAVPGITAAMARRFCELRAGYRPQASLSKALEEGYGFTTLADETYPAALLTIDFPPVGLFFLGELSCLDGIVLAVVGARAATEYGTSLARRLSRELAEAGICIASGLARGIDTAAHLGALEAEGGVTAAVQGCGIDICYPGENAALRERIAERGVVVSEFALGTRPLKANFPRRNRVLSGLARGALVVEADTRSGSLVTARHALDQGRDLFAVPGDVGRPMSRGTNGLLKQGAGPVTEALDILQEYDVRPAPRIPATELSPDETTVLELLEARGVHADWLAERTGGVATPLPLVLAGLITKGVARRLPGNRYARTSA